MKFNFYLMSTIAIATIATACTAEMKQNQLTPEEKAEGWELLFDGTTLNGWRDYNGDSLTAPWFAEDGMIQAKGEGSDKQGYIVTEKVYENFELVWDWKIAKGGNSGVLYHVVENPKFAVPYVTGPEYQLIDEENFPEPLEDWQKTAADYAMHTTDTDQTIIKPAGNGTPLRLFSTTAMWNTGSTAKRWWNLKHGATTGLHAKTAASGQMHLSTDWHIRERSACRIMARLPGSAI